MAGRRAKAIERLRLEASRERIESGSEPIERVAVRTGFGDPERMRRAFIRDFGQRRRPCGGRAGPILLARFFKLSGEPFSFLAIAPLSEEISFAASAGEEAVRRRPQWASNPMRSCLPTGV
jgi:AraC-like DNA-binding protein